MEAHRSDALRALRKKNQDFFTEDKRAKVVLVKDKRTDKSLLIVSFHGKWTGTVEEKAENVSVEDHIKMFLQFVAEMRTRLSCEQVLIGGDTNHVMENFFMKHKQLCDSLDLHLLSYKVPDGHHRHVDKKDQIDYLIHSSSMKPVSDVKAFNVDKAVLDHHPLLATFQCLTVQENDGLSTLVDHAVKETAKAEARMREACSHLSESTLGAGGWMLSKEEPSLNTEGAYSEF